MTLFSAKLNRNGMTLIELIVVLLIISIISVALIPSFSGYIDKANAHRCEDNREILKSNLLTLVMLYPDVTGDGYLNGDYPLFGDVTEIQCPSGGTYTYEGGAIVCSIHGSTAVGISACGSKAFAAVINPAQSVYPKILGSWLKLPGQK